MPGGCCRPCCPIVPGFACFLSKLDRGDDLVISSDLLDGLPISATFDSWNECLGTVSLSDGNVLVVISPNEIAIVNVFDTITIPQCEIHLLGQGPTGEPL